MGLDAKQEAALYTMASRNSVVARRKESVKGQNFRVAVRVRPLIEREMRTGAPTVSDFNSFEILK